MQRANEARDDPVRQAPWSTDALDATAIGEQIYDLAAAIFPLPRSLTGDGVRATLAHLSRHVPLEVHEVASGTPVLDWAVPSEWNVREAWIAGPDGRRVVDFAASTLHVVSYSVPVRTRMPLSELKAHIHTLPEQPTLVPYRTSYYTRQWGFCMSQEALDALPDGNYEVLIDATLAPGSLTYGEYVHRGDVDDEVLLSAHICHPALANDNCSGLALLTMLARGLSRMRTRLTYRFLFAPGTIGALSWLAANEAQTSRIAHGLVVSCVGDGGGPTYKRSRRGDAQIDRAVAHVLRHEAPEARILDFSPYGYDERQYCSPGYNLPVGLFQRSLHGTFPQYHTSADNLDFIRPEHLAKSYRLMLRVLDVIERDRVLVSTCQKGEPQLGRRGLYGSMGGKTAPLDSMALLWVLNLADGAYSLLDMAERSGFTFATIARAAEALETAGLLVPASTAQAAAEALSSPSTQASAK